MKKILGLACLTVSLISMSACSSEKEGAGKPPAPVVVSSPTVTTTTTATATATANCGPGETKTAKAVGENSKVTASCGGSQKAPTAAAKVKAVTSTSSDASLVRKLANENANLKVQMAAASAAASASATVARTSPSSVGVAPLMPRFPEEGRVYSDAVGNTFERHMGGSRECKFYVNGELVKRQFVQHPDPRESKKECDLLASVFIAGLTPTTPEVARITTGSNLPSAPVVASVASGDITCELKFDGKVVETTKTANDSSCKAWTQAKAREKGWIAK